MEPACYPRRLETTRLELLGEPAFYEDDEARERYDARRSLTVAPLEVIENRPAWYTKVSAQYSGDIDVRAYKAHFFAPSHAPLRYASWKRNGETLSCERVIDIFYPDGDPGQWVPYDPFPFVTRTYAPNGTVEIRLDVPSRARGEVTYVKGVDAREFSVPTPAFDDIAAWSVAQAPAHDERFGPASLDAARTFAATVHRAANA